jgi:DNA-binding ferritin-like protein
MPDIEHEKSKCKKATEQMNHSMAQVSVLNCKYHQMKSELEKKDTTIANLKLI